MPKVVKRVRFQDERHKTMPTATLPPNPYQSISAMEFKSIAQLLQFIKKAKADGHQRLEVNSIDFDIPTMFTQECIKLLAAMGNVMTCSNQGMGLVMYTVSFGEEDQFSAFYQRPLQEGQSDISLVCHHLESVQLSDDGEPSNRFRTSLNEITTAAYNHCTDGDLVTLSEVLIQTEQALQKNQRVISMNPAYFESPVSFTANVVTILNSRGFHVHYSPHAAECTLIWGAVMHFNAPDGWKFSPAF